MTLTKTLAAAAALLLGAAAPSWAKTCDELTVEIAAKLDAAGVKGYGLEVLPNHLVGNAQVVGSCENGSKKVVYEKPSGGSAARPAAAPPKPAAKPASGAAR
jgi:hypothetical protein